MKRALNITWIILLIVLTVAIFTKPSHQETFFKITRELNSRGYQSGLYFKYDRLGHRSSDTANSTVVIKDRLFYRDVYFPIKGKVQRIAIAAFSRLFLID